MTVSASGEHQTSCDIYCTAGSECIQAGSFDITVTCIAIAFIRINLQVRNNS